MGGVDLMERWDICFCFIGVDLRFDGVDFIDMKEVWFCLDLNILIGGFEDRFNVWFFVDLKVGGVEFIDIWESLNCLLGMDLNIGGVEFIERWDICFVVDLNIGSGGFKERCDVWFCFLLVSGVDFRDVWEVRRFFWLVFVVLLILIVDKGCNFKEWLERDLLMFLFFFFCVCFLLIMLIYFCLLLLVFDLKLNLIKI